MRALSTHVSGFSTSLSRTEFPVAAVLNAAELSFSLDLEAMSMSHSTSSPMWQHKFYCAEQTLGFEGLVSNSSEP